MGSELTHQKNQYVSHSEMREDKSMEALLLCLYSFLFCFVLTLLCKRKKKIVVAPHTHAHILGKIASFSFLENIILKNVFLKLELSHPAHVW